MHDSGAISRGKSAETLTFQCPSCGSELTVPFESKGVEGPCPVCGECICSPRLVECAEAVAAAAGSATEFRSEAVRNGGFGFSGLLGDRPRSPSPAPAFKARNTIDPEKLESLKDDGWKLRHRELLRLWKKRREREEFFARLTSGKMGILLAVLFSGVMVYVVIRHEKPESSEPNPDKQQYSELILNQLKILESEKPPPLLEQGTHTAGNAGNAAKGNADAPAE